jgi:hypothetical protein
MSAYDSEERARQTARDYPRLGTYIAELDIPDGSAFRIERTTASQGHYTVWATAGDVLACVTAIRPV